MASPKMTDRAIAYIKCSLPNDGRPVVILSPENQPVMKPYFGDLHVCYLVDKGSSYEYILNRHMRDDGIALDELHAIGLRNLKGLVAKRDIRVQPYGDVFVFLMGGDFEASVILLDEMWDVRFRKYVTGDYAVAIPARDVLAFCDAQSVAGIIELRKAIDRVWPTEDHLISNKIYLRQHGKWQVRMD